MTKTQNEIELIRSSGLFDSDWYLRAYPDVQNFDMDPIEHYVRFGGALLRNPGPDFNAEDYVNQYCDVAASLMNPLLHYIRFGKAEGRRPRPGVTCYAHRDIAVLPRVSGLPDLSDIATIATLVVESGLFSVDYYLANNLDVRKSGIDPVIHYCRLGWKELRKPAEGFDGWWYGVTYLHELRDEVNPLLHFAVIGQHAGLASQPPRAEQNRAGTGHVHLPGTRLRRVCLFAGFDADGIVDDYVLEYLAHLSGFADIYYLADCDMPASELEKLAPYVKGAWACRHQMYDFGSYSLLACKYVGWEKIGEYDELIFANDSCYLVGDLAAVFNRMDARQCDWWGLQATKGIAATRATASNRFDVKIPVLTVKSQMLSTFEADYTYDFLVGSYFVCYRKPVMSNAGFRRLVDSVRKENSKKLIIQKYEIGFTKYLINGGFEFDTYAADLHPFHPIFSETHFELLKEGFPLFKRYLLTENHYRVPELHRWREYLVQFSERKDLAAVEKNLYRVANSAKLYENLHITADGVTASRRLLSDEEMWQVDPHVEKHDNWWVFPVCGYNHTLGGNDRAVFEHVRDDVSIKKIILTRSRSVRLGGRNVVSVPLHSIEGQQYLLQSKVVFIKHTPKRNVDYSLRPELRQFINLWHGIPLKRIGSASLDQQANLERLQVEHRKCKAVIASSKIDQMAMAAAFYPLAYKDIWVTGLPRNDFIVCGESELPADMANEIVEIQRMLKGRRLVLYAPTFRNGGENAYYTFAENEKEALRDVLARHNCVLGIREHLADKSRTYSHDLREIGVLNLSDKYFSNIEVIYRCTDVLITDYSSCFIDFLLTGRPVISFAYDYEQYISQERGLFYDMPSVFPGRICREFDALVEAIDTTLSGDATTGTAQKYAFSRAVFFDHNDARNSARLVERVKESLALK